MQAKQILIGRFVECQSIKKVGGRRSVEELYQAQSGSIFRFAPSRWNVSPSETKIEPDRRLGGETTKNVGQLVRVFELDHNERMPNEGNR